MTFNRSTCKKSWGHALAERNISYWLGGWCNEVNRSTIRRCSNHVGVKKKEKRNLEFEQYNMIA